MAEVNVLLNAILLVIWLLQPESLCKIAQPGPKHNSEPACFNAYH